MTMIRSWLHRRSAAVWLGVACTVISWAGLAAYWGTHRMVRSYNSAAESHRAPRSSCRRFSRKWNRAESSVDAYVITGKEARLEPFLDASLHVPDELGQMQALMSVYPEEAKPRERLERMTLGHLSYLRNVARVRRGRGFAAAASWIATEDSGSPRALTRQLLGDLQHSESLNVRTRTASASQRSKTAVLILTLAALVSLGFLVWAFILWRRESGERAHAERER